MRKTLSATPASKVAVAIALGVLGASLCYALPALGIPIRGSALAPSDGLNEVWVDDDYDASTPGWGVTHFAAVQDGINAVAQGGTVHVLGGTYVENVVITKSLSLLGTGSVSTTIDGQNLGPAVSVNGVDNVMISSFTFTGYDEFLHWNVEVHGGQWITVTQNHIAAGGGILLDTTLDVNVTDNTLNGHASMFLGGACNTRIEGNELYVRYPGQIWVWAGSNNAVISNTLTGYPGDASCTGIRVWHASNNLCAHNTLRNFRVHILLSYADDSILANNDIAGMRHPNERAGGGIVLYHANGNQLVGNTISAVSEGGITLFGASSHNIVAGNTVTSTDKGIEFYFESNYNYVISNTVMSNSYGVLLDETAANTVTLNSLLDNTHQAYDDGTNQWHEGGQGNYWSDYAGSDDNGDGIGDSPYLIPPVAGDPYPLMDQPPASTLPTPSLTPISYEEPRYYPPLVIDDHIVWESETRVLTQQVQIKAGGSLEIHNANVSQYGPIGALFIVQAGGALTIAQSKLDIGRGSLLVDGGSLAIYDSRIDGQGGVVGTNQQGSRLHIQDSELVGLCDWDGGGAVSLGADGAVIKNNVIRDAYVGIAFAANKATGHTILGNRISRVRSAIRSAEHEAGATIANNDIAHVMREGIDLLPTQATIAHNAFRDVWGAPIYVGQGTSGILAYENSVVNSGEPYDSGDATAWYNEHRGNYWSDYAEKYPDAQEHPLYAGVWDIPYEIGPGPDVDPYPLIYSTPSVWDEAAPLTSAVTATLETHLLMKEHPTVTISFQYRKAGATSWQSTSPMPYAASGVHTATLTGLEPTTTYEFRVLVAHGYGSVLGDVYTFTTEDTLANFTAFPIQGIHPLTVTFTATAEPPATYLWDFGDQVTSTLRNPIHTYTEVGFYTVTLTVSTTVESDTLSRSRYISVWRDQICLPLVMRNY